MSKYELIVSALGYDTTKLVVLAGSLREAQKSRGEAIGQWLSHNDLDSDSIGLASVRTLKLSSPPADIPIDSKQSIV